MAKKGIEKGEKRGGEGRVREAARKLSLAVKIVNVKMRQWAGYGSQAIVYRP